MNNCITPLSPYYSKVMMDKETFFIYTGCLTYNVKIINE